MDSHTFLGFSKRFYEECLMTLENVEHTKLSKKKHAKFMSNTVSNMLDCKKHIFFKKRTINYQNGYSC